MRCSVEALHICFCRIGGPVGFAPAGPPRPLGVPLAGTGARLGTSGERMKFFAFGGERTGSPRGPESPILRGGVLCGEGREPTVGLRVRTSGRGSRRGGAAAAARASKTAAALAAASIPALSSLMSQSVMLRFFARTSADLPAWGLLLSRRRVMSDVDAAVTLPFTRPARRPPGETLWLASRGCGSGRALRPPVGDFTGGSGRLETDVGTPVCSALGS
mmetsp:Transcript_13/g.43  ORF Transcript_13/g.43 Transcript_13/m.43 type:complete len:218 (+) Transcript_13:1754-2407(+)